MPSSFSAQLDLDWVTRGLAIGSGLSADSVERLVERFGIHAVVDCQEARTEAETALQRHGVQLLHLPELKNPLLALETLERGVAWVNEKLAVQQKVLIQCEQGVGWSAVLATCVLVGRGHEPLDALSRLKLARKQASPSPEQLEVFRKWTRAYLRRCRARWNVPPFIQLAQIAYSHLRSGQMAQ